MASEIARLVELGQSPWYDNLDRHLLRNSELAALVHDHAIRGVTSNPTILAKAISGGDAYEEQLAGCAHDGLGPDDAYWAIVIADIVAAADLLRPVYDVTAGADGFVSLEVSPLIAHDTDATIAAARPRSG